MKQRKGFYFFLSVLILSLFLLFPEVFAKEVCVFCEYYKDLGFPKDYAASLCAISTEHPNWEFEPLPITSLSREIGEEYDFPTVLEKEMEVEERNLVFAEEDFCAYWDPAQKSFDSGFYSANREAVAYFLDPRNFLSEEGVFQFLLLSGGEEISAESLEKILSATPLSGKILANQKSVAEELIFLE